MNRRLDVPNCPMCGQLASGMQESVPGLALLLFDGTGAAHYQGETQIDWNGQAARLDHDGRATLECPAGHAWQTRMTAIRDSPSTPIRNVVLPCSIYSYSSGRSNR